MKSSLEILLDKLDLNENNGLFLKENEINIYSRIKNSLKYIDYDALYMLGDNPLIIFKEYDNINEFNNTFGDFQKAIWNLNDVPIIFIILPDEIQVYNANIFEDESSVLDKFACEDDLSIFNVSSLVNGTFFDKYSNFFNNSLKVYNYLLDNIKVTISLLVDNGLNLDIIHNLIGKLIFLKYLVDRDIYNTNDMYGVSFEDVILNKGLLFDFFNIIDNHDLFTITDSQKELITDKHLKYLSFLFKGMDMKNNQTVLDCPYDFKIIPVELISNIYETFLNSNNIGDKKAYYTPLFLVDYILNRTLDKKLETTNNCKVLDPSCGSGVFLVESLRRIIDKNLKTNNTLSPQELKDILSNNIYGVDVDKHAVNISILSVQLTVYDYLDDEQVKEFKMPQLLNKNFFVDDFFDLTGEFNNLDDFDLVVGNPPWGAKQDLHIKYCRENNVPLSNKEIVQSFLIRVKDFINNDSQVALIVSSKILYNEHGKNFRKYFLENFHLSEVFEFSPVRKEIFHNAIGPGSILFYTIDGGGDDLVTHISLKPNKLFYLLSSIVIQKSDIKYIRQTDLINNDWVWKVMLYGNTLDFELIRRLRNKKTVNDLIEDYDLIKSTGMIVGGNPGEDATQYFDYDFLDVSNKNNMLNRYNIDESNAGKWDIPLVSRKRFKETFTPPYVLIKKGLNSNFQCVSTYSDKKWVFKDSIRVIKGDTGDEKILKTILAFLNSKLFTYFSFLTFSSVGVEREQIFAHEITSIPVVLDDEIVAYVDEILNDYSDELQDKIDEQIFKSLSFNELEMDLVDYVFDVTIPMLKKEDVYHEVSRNTLTEYINIFINHFKHYFDEKNNEYFHARCYVSNQFVGINFIIDDEKYDKIIEFSEKTDILNFFGNISIEDKNDLFVHKDIKGFNETSFYVIKTNEFKNWHKAIARRDLIEFMNALMGVDD